MQNEKVNILIVDDIETNLLFLEELLYEIENVEIVSAKSAFEALEKVKEYEFALGIFDIQMPEMNGYELLLKIRDTKKHKGLPVIFISGIYQDEEYILKGIETGAVDFMPKPFNNDILIAKARIFIELYHQRKELDELILKLKKANIKLKLSETRFRKIAMVAVESIVVVDNFGKILIWNDAAEKVFGYKKVEITNRLFKELFSPSKYNNKLPESLQKYFKKDSLASAGRTLELIAIRKNKLEFPVEISISSFIIDDKINAVCIIRDLSRSQRIEKELLKAKELKEANKVMKQFMDNMNHELRTPLNAIIGISKNLSKYNQDNLNDKQKEGLQIIHKNGEKLNILVERLFEFRQKKELRISDFSLNEFIDRIDEFAKKITEEKPVICKIHRTDPLTDTVSTDKNKLYQIIINIIENAVKFTEKGSVNITFSTVEDKLKIKIEDTGIGMKEEDLKEIFKKFTQIDGTSARKYGGTGLGLALTNKFIKLLEGEISVKSELNKGTTFEIEIPAFME